MLEFETIKELYKQSIDESDNMNEALQRLFDKVYEKGKEDAEKECAKKIEDAEAKSNMILMKARKGLHKLKSTIKKSALKYKNFSQKLSV